MHKLLSCLLLLSGAVLARESLTLTAADQTQVHAEYHAPEGTPRAAVLLFHQFTGNTCEYGTFPEKLSSLGYAVLTVDLRIGGSSFGCSNQTRSPVTPDMWEVPLDIEAAVQWMLQKTGLPKVVLTGSSYSGGQVLMYAGNHPEQVQGVAAFSPATDIDLIPDVINAVKNIQVPVLFVAPQTETGFPTQLLPLIPAAQKTLSVVAGNIHGAVGLVLPETEQEYQKLYLAFLASLE